MRQRLRIDPRATHGDQPQTWHTPPCVVVTVDDALELRSVFDRLGAAPWVERARLELLATGQTARRIRGPALEELTPQEFQVAQLLAGGGTRELAAKLYLSPKTVEFHLRNAYDKLGVRSRSALSQLMSEEQP